MSYEYERFWNIRGRGFDDHEWSLLLGEVKDIQESSGLKLLGPFGESKPTITGAEVSFQGSPGNEPFIFSRYANESSCDTNGLPYDDVVVSILAAAKKISSDKIEIPWFLTNTPLRRIYASGKWEKMPKGWTDESRKKFWGSLTSAAPKHKVTECIKQMEGKVDDPGAFCASLADKVTPGWRDKKKKANTETSTKSFILDFIKKSKKV